MWVETKLHVLEEYKQTRAQQGFMYSWVFSCSFVNAQMKKLYYNTPKTFYIFYGNKNNNNVYVQRVTSGLIIDSVPLQQDKNS